MENPSLDVWARRWQNVSLPGRGESERESDEGDDRAGHKHLCLPDGTDQTPPPESRGIVETLLPPVEY